MEKRVATLQSIAPTVEGINNYGHKKENIKRVKAHLKKMQKCIKGMVGESNENDKIVFVSNGDSSDTCLTGEEVVISVSEIREEFLKEYESGKKESSFTKELYNAVLNYNAIRSVERLKRVDPKGYKEIYKEAKNIEADPNKKTIPMQVFKDDMHQSMVNILRFAVKKSNEMPNLDVGKFLSYYKESKAKLIKKEYKKDIKGIVTFLNQYGLIDDYMQTYNDMVQDTEAKKLIPSKQAGIAMNFYLANGKDITSILEEEEEMEIPELVEKLSSVYEQYDFDKARKEGKIKPDRIQEVGVMDFFDDEYSYDNIPAEEVMALYTAWVSRYYIERRGINSVIGVVEQGDLWEQLVMGDETTIDQIDGDLLNGLYKQNILLERIAIDNDFQVDRIETTKDCEEEYRQFLERIKLCPKSGLQEDIEKTRALSGEDLGELETFTEEFEYLLLEGLASKRIPTIDWGIVDKDENKTMVVVNFPHITGAFGIEYVNLKLKEYMEMGNIKKVPEYKSPKFLETDFVAATSMIFTPTTPYFCIQLKDMISKIDPKEKGIDKEEKKKRQMLIRELKPKIDACDEIEI